MTRLISFLAISFLLVSGCKSNDNQDYSLKVQHYAGGAGLTLIYFLDENGLQVDTNCDLENCKEKTVYKRTFTKNESDSIYKSITSLQLDTLKPTYVRKGYMDGLYTKLTFKKGFFSSHTSSFDNIKTAVTDTLFNFIDNLVLTKKYKFHNWGQDE